MIHRLAVALALVVGVTAAHAATSIEHQFSAGIPCPVDGKAGPGWSGPAAAARRVGPEVSLRSGTDGEDLKILRWRGVPAYPVSDEIPLVVEEGTVGLIVRAEAERDLFAISVELLGPDGGLLACRDCEDAPAVGQIWEGRGATQMPSTDRPGWELKPGTYAFRVRSVPFRESEPEVIRGTDVDIVVTLRTDAAVSVERYIDLNFIYLPGSGLDREIAQESDLFAQLLEHIDEWMAPTGIQVGRVTHNNLQRDEFSRIADWYDAGKMMITSAELGRPRTLNVYCVEHFDSPLTNVVGLSGGIPGPIDNGTADAGIAIRMPQLFTCNQCLDAYGSLFAHEIGHYLGLYHTSAADQKSWDPFLDTPQCEGGDLRRCPDFDYVMFPLIHPANTIWSPGQIEVVRTHPIVYTVPVLRSPTGVRETPAVQAAPRPNPFQDGVELSLAPGDPWFVSVHDVSGRRVQDLGRVRGRVVWDGRDAAGVPVRSGVYYVRAARGEQTRTHRIVKAR